MSNNILEFPKSAIVRDPPSQKSEQLEAIKAKSVVNYAEALIADLSEDILLSLDSCGIDTEAKDFIKDYCLIQALLSASIYRSLGLHHDLQSFIDDTVSVITQEDVETSPELPLIPPPGSTS